MTVCDGLRSGELVVQRAYGDISLPRRHWCRMCCAVAARMLYRARVHVGQTHVGGSLRLPAFADFLGACFAERIFHARWPACFALLALGVLCLLVDVGRPERLFNLLFSPQPTAMSVGSYAIAVTLFCSGAFSAMSLLDNVEPSLERCLWR